MKHWISLISLLGVVGIAATAVVSCGVEPPSGAELIRETNEREATPTAVAVIPTRPVATRSPTPTPDIIATAIANRPSPTPTPDIIATAIANRPSPTPTPDIIATAIANRPSPTPTPDIIATAIANRPPTPTPWVIQMPTAVVIPRPSPVAATATPLAVPTVAASAEVKARDLVTGDCVNVALDQPIYIDAAVEIVLCTGPWEYKVLGFVEVDVARYPGEEYLWEQAKEHCGRRVSWWLFPSEDAWDVVGRELICLQRSFGLSAVDPAKLDRLVLQSSLLPDECFNFAPETDWSMVELVDCSGRWERRVLESFEVERRGTYPGDEYFLQEALARCNRQYTDLLFPVEESWSGGGRTVVCTQDSFGLSVVNPAKLHRLVRNHSVLPGECFNDFLERETDLPMAELVDCSGPWEKQVLESFEVDDLELHPGERYFSDLAVERCDRRFSYVLYPYEELWSLGGRVVNCVQQSFGLSVVDPAKLDRLVRFDAVLPEECFRQAPETEWVMVELLDCSGAWEYRVVGTFEVDELERYPGEGYFYQQAVKQCDRRHSTFLNPDEGSWSVGDRTVTCFQDSFGLSVTDPEKLDRLVNFNAVRPEDCFRWAPETEWTMVEVVSCSESWEWDVTKTFDVPWDGEFPGDGYFETQKRQECGEQDHYWSPTATSWEWGDRKVICAVPQE